MTEHGAAPSRAAVLSVIGALEGLGRPTVAAPPAAAIIEAPPAPPAPVVPVAAPAPARRSTPSPFQASSALPTPMPAAPPTPAPVPVVDQAASARHDQVAAALREMTAERDAWRTEASSLRDSLTQHLEGLRGELAQHLSLAEVLRAEVDHYRVELEAMRAETKSRDEQISHLSTAMTALIQLAQSRADAQPAPAAQQSRATNPGASSVPYSVDPAAAPAAGAPMVIPALAPDQAPADDKPRLGVERTRLLPNPATAQQPDGVVAP
jgi:hypothetical protein